MLAVVREFMDDLVDMVFIRLAEFGTHIAVKHDPIRGAFAQIGDKFGLILFRAVVGCFEIGAGDIFAMVHTHHLFGSIREKIFLEGYFAADEFERHCRRVSSDEGEHRFVFIRFGSDLTFGGGEFPFPLEGIFHPSE